MISFESDYIEGAHPSILESFEKHNYDQVPGYGFDKFTAHATELIREASGCQDADVYYLIGGTQTNQVVIDTMLQPYEGVVAPETGHIAVHEAGAVEFTGHKILTVPSHDGKMDATELRALVKGFYDDQNHEHMVFPGLIFLTFPTELGTIYTKKELQDIRAVADEFKLPVYVDGARLGYGLMSSKCDLTFREFVELVDVFYIGGTKVGALCGEAVVFKKGFMPAHFATRVKQHGAMIAKGRLLSQQFETLFTDNLYFDIASHAIRLADKLKAGFAAKGYEFYIDSPTNQQFFIFSKEEAEYIGKEFRFSFWEKLDEERTVYRFVTSWATKEENVDKLLAYLPEHRS
ncbi:MAG: aminotransferase class I/II-fold pyridoxal phosphate-dependent enzyme [Erysipelotrichaceae bacterium]|nr:aminotransferase class I/II-fold pyridoxal phosphate-dependent enzyme [Erysipelotrichaceae bacterium]